MRSASTLKTAVSTATKLANRRLDSCILNAASFAATTHRDITQIAATQSAGGVTTRTSLLDGFEHDDKLHTWTLHSGGTINCYGYSPYDAKYYLDVIANIKRKTTKPLVMSVIGTPLQIHTILKIASEKALPPDAIEVNLSCPNIPNKPPISYSPEMKEYLEVLRTFKDTGSDIAVGVKLAPSLFESQFQEQAEMLNTAMPDFVTAINTVGHGLVIDVDSEQPLLSGHRYGGLGGRDVKSIALGNVRRLYELLDNNIDIIGVGGISSGEDAFRHILCGAKVVEIASILLHEGPGVFNRIISELQTIMEAKGYSSIEDFRGKLQEHRRSPSCTLDPETQGQSCTLP